MLPITAEDIIYKLYQFFKVNNNLDLGKLLNTTPQTISNWKSRNSTNAIKKKCKELGIYNEIFKENEQEKEIRIQEDILLSIHSIFELAEKKDLIRALKNDLAKMYTKYFIYDKNSKDEHGKNIFPNEIIFIGEDDDEDFDEEVELKRLKKVKNKLKKENE